jgi:ABC-type antimicrobial peptide transport system permease subunit
MALLLSCLGIYGVTSAGVSRRTKEIGIRMALGAQARNILTIALRGSMVPVMLGGIMGLALSVGLMPLLSSLLYGVRALDATVLLCVLLFLFFVGVIASCAPTWRVLRRNPINALRCE